MPYALKAGSMLFLGAGASKPLGIPTMAEFTETIIQRIPSYGPKIRKIQANVKKFGLNPDIEAILSVLEAERSPKKALNDIGPIITVFSQEYPNITEDSISLITLMEIEDIIYDTCTKIRHGMAIQLYRDLWDGLRTLSVRTGPNESQWVGDSALRKIFTTNYDSSVETFLKNRGIGFDEGFHQDNVGDIAFDGTWTQGPVHLFKLHGSINYYVKEDGKVVRSEAPLPILETDFFGRQVRARMMVYPIGEKYATRSPFYEYLGQLRQALREEKVCVVIGYSFRDLPINSAFVDGIKKNPDLRVLLLGPSADKVREGMDVSIQRNLRALNGSFGTDTGSPKTITTEFLQWPIAR